MKFLLFARMPLEPFNAHVRDGSAGKRLNFILESLKPEAAYFTELDGKRTAVLVVDLPDASKIPSLAEPWFLQFHAEIELRAVMTPEDLGRAGLDALGAKWS